MPLATGSNLPASHAASLARLALALALLVQILVTMAMAAAAVLAPAVAPSLGLAPERVGVFAAVGYLAAALSGLRAGDLAARRGTIRISQAALLASALGAVLAAAAPLPGSSGAAVALLLAAATLVGCGYGMTNPSAAALLGQHAPADRRGLYFSIKQTGVPAGVALAGVLLPLGLAAWGWQAAVLGVALVCVVACVWMQASVRTLDCPARATRATAAPIGLLADVRLNLAAVWQAPGLRRLAITSLVFAMAQQCFVTFLVAMLHLELHWSLAMAAGVLAISQVASVLARVGLGALGDRWRDPERVLVMVGFGIALGALTLAQVTSAWPRAAVLGVAVFCAATAMGWNGVYFAELARQVPKERLGRITGATQFLTFGGGFMGPFLFAELIRAGAGYGLGYTVVAFVSLAAAVNVARHRQLRRRAPQASGTP